MSNNTLILGLQWGDEGKGKIVDALAETSEAVCRFQGGHNAGHTLKVDGEQKVLHLVPSGILHPSVHCVLGNGLVLSLPALSKEIQELQDSDISFKDRFYVSEDCSLILPTHIAIDKVRDKQEGIGTTGRGADHVLRLSHSYLLCETIEDAEIISYENTTEYNK